MQHDHVEVVVLSCNNFRYRCMRTKKLFQTYEDARESVLSKKTDPYENENTESYKPTSTPPQRISIKAPAE
jgi:hypothetical protein